MPAVDAMVTQWHSQVQPPMARTRKKVAEEAPAAMAHSQQLPAGHGVWTIRF
jgi:hypothetical protein